ncbi:metal ABC transporter substrate-binding protein [Sinomonas cyclohexanicum]|uniref:Metal ABC transporter substrate-binding protein n=1 Tax=Sinomonas cyclohexanicum TaxID=322009 RepID=A0ABN6FIJ2_SINCY|nr:zinc ABC transporter substrate-binding protein [Corynebacterium cyclohexanicum]BCT76717.1 metal ABC transporter substrate-binding protein [Corynebacterium cyclohexanicum]
MRSFTVPAAGARVGVLGVLAVAASLGLAACASGSPGTAGSGTAAAGTVAVVASTNVYGDLAKAVGGDRVSVTSIVSKTSQDPHSYEATSQDRLAVSKAKLVIENGGGYDPFLSTLAGESRLGDSAIITAVQVAGLEPAGTPSGGHSAYNEHVWYDLAAMEKVTATIADRLGALDPGGKAAYDANAKDVEARLTALEDKVAALKGRAAGKKAAVTEPVPLYLLEAAGLTNATPAAFTSAIEEGQDVPPAVFKETLDLVTSKTVALLAYNPQTQGAQTEQLRKAAESAGVPVAEFTETVPPGTDYLAWMQANVDALAKALP